MKEKHKDILQNTKTNESKYETIQKTYMKNTKQERHWTIDWLRMCLSDTVGARIGWLTYPGHMCWGHMWQLQRWSWRNRSQFLRMPLHG